MSSTLKEGTLSRGQTRATCCRGPVTKENQHAKHSVFSQSNQHCYLFSPLNCSKHKYGRTFILSTINNYNFERQHFIEKWQQFNDVCCIWPLCVDYSNSSLQAAMTLQFIQYLCIKWGCFATDSIATSWQNTIACKTRS